MSLLLNYVFNLIVSDFEVKVKLLLVCPVGAFKTNVQFFVGDFGQTAVTQFTIYSRTWKMPPSRLRSVHNTGDNVPYSFRQASRLFNVPYNLITNNETGDETGPTV